MAELFTHRVIKKGVAMAISNVKDFIYEYTRKRHFDQMPPETRARYDEYKKNKDFASGSNVESWVKDLDGHPVPSLDSAKYNDLYKMFQAMFENMAQNKKKFIGKNKAVETFFNNWFGDTKLFNHPQPEVGVDSKITDFVNEVLKHRDPVILSQIKNIFNPKNPDNTNYYIGLPDDFDYNAFVSAVERGDYKTDAKVRSNLVKILNYVQNINANIAAGGGIDPKMWPAGLTYDITAPVAGGPALDPDPNKWFNAAYNPAFRFAMPNILSQLIDSKSLRDGVKDYDSKGIIGQIENGINDTDYSNKSSKDYIAPKVSDKKNIFERFNDSVEKFKENSVEPWTNILRGTRRFFTPYSKTILDAISKVKTKDGKPLKPTDGLKGIIDNKDAILKKIELSPTAKKHFEWFVEKMDGYSKTMPKAFNGALYNPAKMRHIVEQLIYDTLADGKNDMAQAKTAMEILSTMKYGIMHSRLADAMKKEEFTWLSHKDLSWNKYDGVRIVTNALDKLTKYTIIGTVRVGAAIRNKWMRDHTKFRGKFKNNLLNKARANALVDGVDDINNTFAGLDADLTTARGDYQTSLNNLRAAGYPSAANLETAINNDIAAKTTLNQDLQNLNQKLQNTQQKLDDETNKLQQLNQQKQRLEDEKSKLDAIIVDIDDRLNDANALLPTLTDPTQIAETNRAIANLARAKAAAVRKQTKVQDDINNVVQPQINRQEQIVQRRTMVRDRRQTNVNNKQNDINTLQSQIDNKQQMLRNHNDIKDKMVAIAQQRRDVKQQKDNWKQNHPDKYLQLMAFWDMLESFGKSHHLTFAADQMRKRFLTNYNTGNSRAQMTQALYESKYERRHAA